MWLNNELRYTKEKKHDINRENNIWTNKRVVHVLKLFIHSIVGTKIYKNKRIKKKVDRIRT